MPEAGSFLCLMTPPPGMSTSSPPSPPCSWPSSCSWTSRSHQSSSTGTVLSRIIFPHFPKKNSWFEYMVKFYYLWQLWTGRSTSWRRAVATTWTCWLWGWWWGCALYWDCPGVWPPLFSASVMWTASRWTARAAPLGRPHSLRGSGNIYTSYCSTVFNLSSHWSGSSGSLASVCSSSLGSLSSSPPSSNSSRCQSCTGSWCSWGLTPSEGCSSLTVACFSSCHPSINLTPCIWDTFRWKRSLFIQIDSR